MRGRACFTINGTKKLGTILAKRWLTVGGIVKTAGISIDSVHHILKPYLGKKSGMGMAIVGYWSRTQWTANIADRVNPFQLG